MAGQHAAELYDAVNTWGADDEFFLTFATVNSSDRVLDLGCGTGRITSAIAEAGHDVTGVDPQELRITAATKKPQGRRVQWIVGDSRAIPSSQQFDVAIMSANVIQEILENAELARTFRDIAAHLPPGGRLAFDSRDPNARGWEQWTKDRSHKVVQLPAGHSEHWYQTTSVDETSGLVDFCAHEITAEGLEQKSCGSLRFRTEDHLRALLVTAGFTVDEVFGGFTGELVGQGVGTLVFTAHRT